MTLKEHQFDRLIFDFAKVAQNVPLKHVEMMTHYMMMAYCIGYDSNDDRFKIHAKRIRRSDGVEFDSLKKAAISLACDPNYLCDRIKQKKTYKGYSFKYLT